MAHTDPHHHGGHAHGHGAGSAAAVGHETSDATLSGVWQFIVIVTVFLALSFVLVAAMVWYFERREAALDVKPSPVVPRQGDRLPPIPRLQVNPPQDLAAFRHSETRSLDTWRWLDQQKTVAQIPISRALDILAERGLPVPSASAAAAAAAATAAPATGSAPAAEPRRPGN